ncbi:mycofactocin biosynthesis glycosyltransferase MftF [Microbacterium sp. B2969]|uniref:Mycofactocin biosynthesis glycosyltransferase MftF n=1 Tax=Microbacterium alkaliflavum TaxID=3248839 RepID=A0ABW7Q6U9_9MICO
MSALPDGFTVRLDRRTRVVDGGRVLIGGAPTRVARLKPAAARVLRDRELVVRDPVTRGLAEHLLATGLGDPVVATLPAIPLTELTVVIPVRDRPTQLARLLASVPPQVAAVLVVDDASRRPQAVASVVSWHGARLIPLEVNVGAAAARNAGLAQAATPFVAFIDSDVVLQDGCLDLLLRHFADPRLAMAAPRVLGLDADEPNWITRYENARSSLDLGGDAASVRPRSPVTWVSSTCLVARIAHLGAGFDASMRVGEDVDLVWRLVDDGFRVRFEPAATVLHEHRTRLRTWLGRKFFYGTGAHLLSVRHPDDVAPVVLPPWGALVLALLLAQRRWSIPAVALTGVVVAGRIAKRLGHTRRPWPIAGRLTGEGMIAALGQGFALLLRHWWPATLAVGLFSPRVRRAAAIAAVADVVWEYLRLRPRLDPVRFGAARRLDDLAYGAGVWWGALRGRSPKALLPAIVRSGRARRSAE